MLQVRESDVTSNLVCRLTTATRTFQGPAGLHKHVPPRSSNAWSCCATRYHPDLRPSAQVQKMNTDMEIDPEIAAMMGFGSFGGNKKRKFGADEAFTDAQPAGGRAQEPQQVVSNANAVPVAETRTSRPANAPVAGKFRRHGVPSDHY